MVQPVVRYDPGDMTLGLRDQRVPGHRAADHRLGQELPGRAGDVGLTLEILPESPNILLQIAKNQVSAIAPEIAFCWIISSAGQQVVWVRDGIEQGAVGEVAVLVLAAEEEL